MTLDIRERVVYLLWIQSLLLLSSHAVLTLLGLSHSTPTRGKWDDIVVSQFQFQNQGGGAPSLLDPSIGPECSHILIHLPRYRHYIVTNKTFERERVGAAAAVVLQMTTIRALDGEYPQHAFLLRPIYRLKANKTFRDATENKIDEEESPHFSARDRLAVFNC